MRAMIWRWCWLGVLVWPGERLWAQAWHRVVTPSFTIYSQARPDETRRIAEEFQQFILALGEFVPIDARRLPPLTLVVLGSSQDFERFWPRMPGGGRAPMDGFFTRRAGWAVAGLGGGRFFNDSVRQTVFHEGVHWYLSAFDGRNPTWLEEGLAEVFSTFSLHRDRVQWGQMLGRHAEVLQWVKLIPLERFLSITQADSYYNELDRVGIFYAQSWLFVHYWIFGAHKQSPMALDNYLRGHREGRSPEAAFAAAFGAGYAEVEKQLKAYVRGGRYFVPTRPARPTEITFQAESATERQVALALAKLALGGNNYALTEEYLDPWLQTGAPDAELYEIQGALANARNDDEGVLQAYEHAVGFGSENPWVFFELAGRWHHRGRSFSGGEMDDETARRIAFRYERAIELQPRFLPAYQGLAGILPSVDSLTQRDWVFLELGAKFYPDDVAIQMGMATLERKLGHAERAVRRLADVRARKLKPGDSENAVAWKRLEALENAWAREDSDKDIQALLQANRPEEALTVLEGFLAGALGPSERIRHTQLYRYVTLLVLLKASAAKEEQRGEEARALLERLRPAAEGNAEMQRGLEERLAGLRAASPEPVAAPQ